MMRYRIISLLVVSSLCACGALPEPDTLKDLEAAVRGNPDGNSDETWERARSYLEDARLAMEDKDPALANRFAEIGLLLIATSTLQDQTRQWDEARRASGARVNALELEIEQLTADIQLLEQAAEREALRSHLLEVVDSTHLRAAAEEELREQQMSPADLEALQNARSIVGAEIIGQVAVAEMLGQMLMKDGVVMEEQLAPLASAARLCALSHSRNNLADVQRYAEIALGEFRRMSEGILDEQWKDDGDSGLVFVQETAGRSVALTAKDGGRDSRGQSTLERIGAYLTRHPDVRVLVVATTDSAAKEMASRRASETVARLLDRGVDPGRVSSLGITGASPLVSLRGRGLRISLLLVKWKNQ